MVAGPGMMQLLLQLKMWLQALVYNATSPATKWLQSLAYEATSLAAKWLLAPMMQPLLQLNAGFSV